MQVPGLDILPVQLGENSELFGIRTSPVSPSSRYGAIILNAGLLHNVGPFRLHVDLSMALSGLGVPAIRIDQSGKGESPARTTVDRSEAMLLDYDDALGSLMELGVEKAIIVGLCSGADDGLRIAEQRDSVAGIVMLDGYARKTTRYKIQHYGSRLRSVKTVGRALSRRTQRLIKASIGNSEADPLDIDIREWLSDDEMCRLLAGLLDKDTRILAVFSQGQDYYNHVGQLGRALGPGCKKVNLQEIFYRTANHTYSATAHRLKLVQDIRQWTEDHFVNGTMD